MALINALTTLADVKTLAGIASSDTTQDARLEAIINSVSSQVSTYCARNFKRQTYTSETYSPSNRQLLILRNMPIVSVSSLTIDGTAQVNGTDYIVAPEYSQAGMLYREWGWSGQTINREYLVSDPVAMRRSIVATYIAGWYLPADAGYVAGDSASLPLDLQYAAQQICLETYIKARRNNWDNLTSLTEGGLSYGWANQSVSAKNNNSGFGQTTAGILNKYRRLVVAA
jgi:hypothetical protein